MAHVLVIGAGVIGLQTANDLLDKGYKVTILAKHWPGDESIEYTSPWAGAVSHTQALSDQVDVCNWQRQTYNHWMDIIENDIHEAKKMGIQRVPIVRYSVDEENDTFTTILIDPNRYLDYLLSRAKSLGVKTVTAFLAESKSFANTVSVALDHLNGKSADIVINCTGLGASKLCDENVFPIRGQTMLVRITPPPPTSRITVWASTPVTYILPRCITPFSADPSDETYYIGGTNDIGNWDPEPTPEISQGILERVKTVIAGWASEDARVEVLKEQVGLRPGRKGGPRVEDEDVEVAGRIVKVVHQYGHAGEGFQISIGSVRKALGLVEQVLS